MRRRRLMPSRDAALRQTPSIPPALRLGFGRRLRRWYRANARDLPWRRTRDPYRILVSELMLQQTQVSRVVGYYALFLERFPSLESVAAAPRAQVMEAWQGLGYYARARNLHTLAKQVIREESSGLPTNPAALQRLPGIGAYTAGAVASFAYEQRTALVDTNVARVIRRLFALRVNPKSTRGQRIIWALAARLLPRTGAATYVHNQALMELGAVICTARVAHCPQCPVRGLCRTAQHARRRVAS